MAPAWAWAAVAVAVAAMSSGGVWFALLTDTPPALKAAWRLTLTAALQAPGAAAQWRAAPPDVRARWRRALPLMAGTGFLLAVHFITWSWSIGATSLAHSLLFVSATPLLIVLAMAGRHGVATALAGRRGTAGEGTAPGSGAGGSVPIDVVALAPAASSAAAGGDAWDTAAVEPAAAPPAAAPPPPASPPPASPAPLLPPASAAAGSVPPTPVATATPAGCAARLSAVFSPAASLPPTRLEVLGAAIGFVAAAVLIGAAAEGEGDGGGQPVTAAGDAMALLGAATMGVYLAVGGALRRWMPLWLYALPVTAAAAASASVLSVAFEPGVTVGGTGPAALFGWVGDGARFGLTLGAAGCSGILGHTLANAALSHINPLVLSVCILAEPMVGSFVGWAAGVQGVPGPATAVAGPLLMVGAAVTTVGARDSGWDAAAARAACGRVCGRGGAARRVPVPDDGEG
jgi:drug/metabolite transporter (DMT)-like permease